MREILPQLLWTGNAHDIRPYDSTKLSSIEALVDLALNEPPAIPPRVVVYLRMPLDDSSENPSSRIELAVATAAHCLRIEHPTLIVCSAGLSRSPTIACAAISLWKEEPMESVLNAYFAKLPHDISPGFWKSVVAAVKNLRR